MSLSLLKSKGLIGTLSTPPACNVGFPYGLGVQGLHEVVEEAYGDRSATTGFVLTAARPARPGALLWISQVSTTQDMGRILETSLREMTFGKFHRLNLVTSHASDALWAAEEAVISGAVSHVLAEVKAADFTSTRRLALASGRHGVPVTLMLPHGREGATAAATRWRIAARPSAPNRYDPLAPGHPRWRAAIERCRTAPSATGQTFDLEWNDETLSLSMVPGLAAGPPAPRKAADEALFRLRAG